MSGKMAVDREVTVSKNVWKTVRVVAIAGVVLAAILLIALIVILIDQTFLPVCPKGQTIKPRNYEKPGVFDDLTPREMKAARDFLLSLESPALKRQEHASINSSYIYMIDLHITLKSAVLQYLDGGHRQPERTAKAIVYRGDLDPPRVEEYLVGPLPNPNYHVLIRDPAYRRLPIPWTSRPVDQIEYKHLYGILEKATEKLYTVFRESYGMHYHNCTKDEACMAFFDVAPRGLESGERKSWFWGFRKVEGFYSHPLGIEIQIEHEGTDVSEWRVVRVIYNGQMYYSIEKLVEQYTLNRLRKLDIKVDPYDQQYSSFERRGPKDYDAPGRGPRFYEPDGRRYSVDGQHVQYVGWNFNFRMRTSTGLQIFDVRFQGERIAYELSLQEAAVFYSGYGAVSGSTNYFDTSWLLGASSYELVPGVDCPGTASFHDSHHFVNSGQPKYYKNSICVFEQNSGMPLRRHYSSDFQGGYSNYGGLVDHFLVVRTILNVWNYDYLIDYIFHLNGVIELKVSATGYVQTTFALAHEKPYGTIVENNVLANLHQHMFHFKADLDIGGRENRYSTLDISKETVRIPWYVERNKTQLKFEKVLKEKEMDAILEFSFDHPKYHLFYNQNTRNKFDYHRAYRVQHGAMSKFHLEEAAFMRAANWARYQMAVTKHKDTEDVSTTIYAQNDPFDPVLDFHTFLDNNDKLVDEDLVVWLTAGVVHIPHSEDIPATATPGNSYTIYLRPYNFFQTCPSVSLSEAVHITPGNNFDTLHVKTFGTKQGSRCFQKEENYEEFNGTTPLI
ncbi:amiloride-sensitive amine oxidase [copper-containing] [Patella vulgata]|uniref:amiloride-sensitive amine oxidase [copper-containing] n=1 Tax=Patella vulgata TaxID=6465 RepID=UPI002180796E|nr:amiloride-sensitive amine oxidase [copper-containing] [Patella vulgata]